ncbi:alpha-2 adrenergic receptor-like [Paramacrobiotus metropolitanus]|uniref:alpha-2 adrenergic receptor-like n=1 Tax=Paramacrobiotus metropolitanus TaxID=2943436 RepID=UPI002445756D|nr:alpha-2 adrenergic receptor-like [Paramacrobiotus metropolitanus]
MNSTSNTTITFNTTQPAAAPSGWTPVLVMMALIAGISFSLNAVMLLLQFLPQTRITSFTVYLIAISIGNLGYLAIVRPIGIMTTATGAFPGGLVLCMFYMYVQFVICQLPVLVHALISINRFWAIRYPVSYRHRHHKKMAISLCAGVLLYVHVVQFPMLMVEYLSISPIKEGCQVTSASWMPWRIADIVLHRFIPLILVIGIYIYIIVTKWKKKRAVDHHEMSAVSTQNDTVFTKADIVEDDDERATEKKSKGKKSPGKKRQVKPFIVLTMTSVSELLCWIPADVYWTMLYVGFRLPGWAYTIISTLYSLQMIFDPLMWMISLK